MDQVEQYNPPPNPGKELDPRFAGYQELYGDESWELDALEPTVMNALIQRNIRQHIDTGLWDAQRKLEAEGRATLAAVRNNYDKVIGFLDDEGLLPEVEIVPEETDEIESDEEHETDADDD